MGVYLGSTAVDMQSGISGSAVSTQSSANAKLKAAAIKGPAAVSFIDDDCRKETYTVLWPVIQAKKIPYGLACPPSHIGESNYMTKDQLMTMINGGCDILSHHLKEYAMTQFDTAEAYEEDVQKATDAFTALGIFDVKGVAYPNGYRVDEYMPVVRKHFDMGFTVDRGINTLPMESCYMKRCEVFPTSGTYTLDDAKKLVDSVATSGGWLIFMTHAWYTTFSADDLGTLIDYVKTKGVDIVGPNEGMESFGNIIDVGYAKKPLKAMSTPYYIVDCLGRVYANTWNYTEMSVSTRTELNLPYHTGYTLTTSGTTKSNSDVKRIITDKITAAAGEKYVFCSLSAKYGNCFYVIYNSSNTALAYKATSASSTGETLDEFEITMPANTAYFRLACDLGVNDEMFKAYKVTE